MQLKVSGLIEMLKKLPQDAPVFVMDDGEARTPGPDINTVGTPFGGDGSFRSTDDGGPYYCYYTEVKEGDQTVVL